MLKSTILPSVPDYLVIGHVTRDLLADGTTRAGGTATYAALAAARLGLSVGLLTSADPAFPLLEGMLATERLPIAVHCRPACCTTTFENRYHAEGRTQHLLAVAERLGPADVPALWRACPIVHLGPVAQELDPALIDAFPDALLGVTPQGWMRRWDAQGVVSFTPWAEAETSLERIDVVILSPQDVGHDPQQLDFYRRHARLLVITLGAEGALVCTVGREARVPAFQVEEVDPTGAGDVFATAFLLRLRETGEPLAAAHFANAAASFVVEGVGVSTIPTRAQVEERLRHGRRRA